jgi:hypothetical protein
MGAKKRLKRRQRGDYFIERLDKPKRILLYFQTRFDILKAVKGLALSEGDVFMWSMDFWRIGI